METSKNHEANKSTKKRDIQDNNDQLGENASEEYKSEEYSNATTNENKKKDFK